MRWRVVGCAVLMMGCPKNEGAATATASTTTTSTSTTSTTTPPTAVAGPRVVSISSDSDLASAIRSETQRAKREGRVALVYIGATWCPPCKKLKAALETDAAKQKLGRVTLLELDVDTDGDRLNALGYASKYIPFFAIPRADGHASDEKLDTNFKKTASGDEVVDKLADFVARAIAN